MLGFVSIRRDQLLLTLLTLVPGLTGCAVIPGPHGIPKIVGMSAETAAVVQRAHHQQVAHAPATRTHLTAMHHRSARPATLAKRPTTKAPETVCACQSHAHAQRVAAVEHAVAAVHHQEQPVQTQKELTLVSWEQQPQPLRRVPPSIEPTPAPAVAAEQPGVVQLSAQHQHVPMTRTAARPVPRRLAAQIQAPTRTPAPVAVAPETLVPPAAETVAQPVAQQVVSLPIPPCGPCEDKPAPPPQIHTDQIAALMKRVASMEAELQSSNQSIATLHKALMKANAEVKRLNASVTHWQSEVKRLEVAMQSQHETDIESLNRISEMLGVLADVDGGANDEGTP